MPLTLDADRSAFLSKTAFLKGLRCPKYLYLSRYHPELMDEIPLQRQMQFQMGREVGLYARRLFPGGVEIPPEGHSLSEQVRQTRTEMEMGASAIYEAAFSNQGSFTRVDILHKAGGGWEIYEVKSCTKVEEVHLDDVAFQCHVLTGSGLSVNKASLLYIDNQYVRHGEVEAEKLFRREDLTQQVQERQDRIEQELARQWEILRGPMPQVEVGRHCQDPYHCEFHGFCWASIPEDSVLNLRGRGADKYELYRQGFRRLQELPMELLSRHQRIQVEATLQRRDFVDSERIKAFLESLRYPLYFLDFETFDSPIPPFEGTRPYQKIPFQFSLHYIEREGGELRHREFLATPGSDPRREIAERLIDAIADEACIVVYSARFEKAVLENLGDWFPEHRARVEDLICGLRDLEGPFRSKDLYLWQMGGSSSLKAVLPALVPELSYEGMMISDGGDASWAYLALGATADPEEIERVRRALLEYCRLDTLGMVKIVDAMRHYCRGQA